MQRISFFNSAKPLIGKFDLAQKSSAASLNGSSTKL